MIIVGELINSSRTAVFEAIKAKDGDTLLSIARKQLDAGADYIDVNCGALGEDELQSMEWLITLLQEELEVEISIDSADTKVLIRGLEVTEGSPLVNSVLAEPAQLDRVLPGVVARNAKLVGLCMQDGRLPGSVEETRQNAQVIISKARQHGLPMENLYLDPLVRSVATETNAGRLFLDSLSAIRSLEPEARPRTICGLSNISFGMPARKQINRALAVLAAMDGLDAAILDPTDRDLIGLCYAAKALSGDDMEIMSYLTAYRQGKF